MFKVPFLENLKLECRWRVFVHIRHLYSTIQPISIQPNSPLLYPFRLRRKRRRHLPLIGEGKQIKSICPLFQLAKFVRHPVYARRRVGTNAGGSHEFQLFNVVVTPLPANFAGRGGGGFARRFHRFSPTCRTISHSTIQPFNPVRQLL